jgi:uncharacterized protein YdiU (UPF0061 family)
MEPASIHFNFKNTYARLPERFYSRLSPTPVLAPRLIKLNAQLALKLGLDPVLLDTPEGASIFAGNVVPDGAEPMALAYAGHQFGHFVPQLGDGRANLLGEVVGDDGVGYDIQLKGSGATPFSRRGDGRAALGPVLREYLVSEAMAALGVPTTRALAAVITGESVFRETVSPGAVFTRVAASHLRVGTFQYFASQGDVEALSILAQYAIKRHYPEAALTAQPIRGLLDGVIARQARLVAQWMMLGFVHGVMNTDNTSISGETIDYGPCAFLEAYDPAMTFSSIDQRGRYSYSNQSAAMHWNLLCLAEALLPLLEREAGGKDAAIDSARQSLSTFAPIFESARNAGLRRKLGLIEEQEGDAALAEDLLNRMAANQADFTLTFRKLASAAMGPEGDAAVRQLFADPSAYDTWASAWRKRLDLQPASRDEAAKIMLGANPAFIPRNHLVEAAIVAATQRQNFQPFEKLLEVVTRPFTDQPDLEDYAAPARPEERVFQTFCGT